MAHVVQFPYDVSHNSHGNSKTLEQTLISLYPATPFPLLHIGGANVYGAELLRFVPKTYFFLCPSHRNNWRKFFYFEMRLPINKKKGLLPKEAE